MTSSHPPTPPETYHVPHTRTLPRLKHTHLHSTTQASPSTAPTTTDASPRPVLPHISKIHVNLPRTSTRTQAQNPNRNPFLFARAYARPLPTQNAQESIPPSPSRVDLHVLLRHDMTFRLHIIHASRFDMLGKAAVPCRACLLRV